MYLHKNNEKLISQYDVTGADIYSPTETIKLDAWAIVWQVRLNCESLLHSEALKSAWRYELL